MNYWRRYLVLYISLLLLLAAFVFYGVQVSRTVIPPGSTPEQITQQTQKYGLDRPVIQLYSPFLYTFLPGLALLGIYATIGLRRRDFEHWIVTRIFIILMLFANTVTMLNFFVTAHASVQEALPAFWTSLLVAVLALANFVFLLVAWNGRRWGIWAFGICTFVVDTLKFVGQNPIVPILFEVFSIVILIVLVRPAWDEMD